MKLIVQIVELLCFLILTLLGALVIAMGFAITFPGFAVQWIGIRLVRLAERFE